jgi:arylsulfatase A
VPTPDSSEWKAGKRKQKDKRFFADMVTYADKIVGKIISTLEAQGVAERTLLVFVGDNGTHRSISTPTTTGAVKGGKGLTIDTGIHVPMFAYWKGVTPAGAECHDLVDFTDILPTILDVAKVPPQTKSDGHSFVPQLRGEKGTPRTHIFCHYDPRWGPLAKTPTRFVRDKNFKLYHDGRFFNVVKDPLEQTVLTPDSSDAAAKAYTKLQAALDAKPAWNRQPAPK